MHRSWIYTLYKLYDDCVMSIADVIVSPQVLFHLHFTLQSIFTHHFVQKNSKKYQTHRHIHRVITVYMLRLRRTGKYILEYIHLYSP